MDSTTTSYEHEYSTALATAINEWADAAVKHEASTLAELAAAPTKGGWSNLGPVGYYLGRGGLEGIVRAEFNARVAAQLQAALAEGHSPQAALADGLRICREAMAQGLTASSTNQVDNLVALLVAREGGKQADANGWSTLAGAELTAQWHAARACAASTQDAVRAYRTAYDDLRGKADRARSEARTAALELEVASARRALDAAQQVQYSTLLERGVPAELAYSTAGLKA